MRLTYQLHPKVNKNRRILAENKPYYNHNCSEYIV